MNAITLSNVSKRLGGREILKNVNFTVEQGDIFGYLGPNGAGKTTSIRIMLGLFQPSAGQVTIQGRDVRADSNRTSVGFILEMDGLYDNLTAFANLVLFSRIYSGNWSRERIGYVLRVVRLEERANDKVGTYSKGMRQRLALARAMVHDPQVLILDEPTAGVDPTGQIEVRQVILDMSKEGKTILLSSHNLDEVQRICNRIALINKGEIRLYGLKEQLQRDMGHGEVTIETTDPVSQDVIRELHQLPGVSFQDCQARLLRLTIDKQFAVPDLVNFLVGRGVRIEQVQRYKASLEDIYTTILKETERA